MNKTQALFYLPSEAQTQALGAAFSAHVLTPATEAQEPGFGLVLYGPRHTGKSTFVQSFPDPFGALFHDMYIEKDQASTLVAPDVTYHGHIFRLMDQGKLTYPVPRTASSLKICGLTRREWFLTSGDLSPRKQCQTPGFDVIEHAGLPHLTCARWSVVFHAPAKLGRSAQSYFEGMDDNLREAKDLVAGRAKTVLPHMRKQLHAIQAAAPVTQTGEDDPTRPRLVSIALLHKTPADTKRFTHFCRAARAWIIA